MSNKREHVKKETAKMEKLLKSFKYKYKHAHLIEIMSKYLYNESWHMINKKSKGVKMKKQGKENPIDLSLIMDQALDFDVFGKNYLEALKKGVFRNKFCFGVLEESGEWLLKDFTREPNTLYAGYMGTGKTNSLLFSLFTWLLSNGDQTQVFHYNPIRSEGEEYDILRAFPQFNFVDPEAHHFHHLIDTLQRELRERVKKFSDLNVTNIKDYNEKSKEKLDSLILSMEDMHHLKGIIEFEKNHNKMDTVAHKFKEIIKTGRSCGIWIMVTTGKATASEVSSVILYNFSTIQVGKSSASESTYLLNNTKAAKLKVTDKGKVWTDYGLSKYPDITPFKALSSLIYKQNIVHNNSSLIFNKYYQEDITENVYRKNKTLKELLQSEFKVNGYYTNVVIEEYLKRINFKLKAVDPILHDEVYFKGSIGTNDGVNEGEQDYAIMIKGDVELHKKHLMELIRVIHDLKCDGGIVFCRETPSQVLYDYALNNGIEIIDKEDFVRNCQKSDKMKK